MRLRKIRRLVTQAPETFLLVERHRVINLRFNATFAQEAAKLVSALAADDKLVEDMHPIGKHLGQGDAIQQVCGLKLPLVFAGDLLPGL